MRKFKANWRNGFAAILVAIATLLSVSCGGSPKPGKTTALAPSAGGLEFNLSSLDFDAIAVGDSKTVSITVTNSSPAGGGTISVTNIVLTGAGFTLVSPTSAFSLGPAQSSKITVKFAPKKAGSVVGTLSVFIAGSAQSSDIALTGSTITGNQLIVSPAKLNFGSVTLGNTKTLTGTLSVGSSDVTIASASWNGQGYSISGIEFPVTIPANTSITYKVNFSPQNSGSISGGAMFVSDAPNSPGSQTFSGTGGMSTPAAEQHSVSLEWSLQGGIDGYNIYRGTRSGGPYTKLNASPKQGSSYTDSTVKSGTTYFYVATAIDSGMESAYSDEVEAAVPSP